MITVLIILLIFISALIGVIIYQNNDAHDGLFFLSSILLVASVLVLIICSIFIFDENVFADSHRAQLQAERDALIYQINNKLYVGNAIGEFNAKVISGKYAKLNPWTNWFVGDYILEIELIDVEEKNK